MKRLTMTFAVLLTAASMAFCGTKSDPKESRVTIVPGFDRQKVFYTGEEEMVVKIRLIDPNGRLLRTDRVKNKNGFMKPYNTSSLSVGEYTFEISDELGMTAHTFQIPEKSERDLMVIKTLKDKKYKLILDQKVVPFQLTIYDGNNDIIHKETCKDLKAFTRVYDLSKFDSEPFTFELTDDQSKRIVSID